MTLLLLLQMTQGQEVMIDPLENGPGLLPFNLGTTRIISHYHSFLNYINLSYIQSKVDIIKSKVSEFRPKLTNKNFSLFEPHMDYLTSKLNKISAQLETFEHSRHKRGLIDGLGSVIKSISGNLDQTDAVKYDNAIKILQENEHRLESQINQHVSLSKIWILHNTNLIANITKNQEKISDVLNRLINNSKDLDLIHYAHLSQYLTILSDNIDSLFEELRKLEYTLAFIRASSTPHTVISLVEIRNMLDKLKNLYSKDEILEIELRDYYDIIKLGYFYINDQIVIVLKVPIAFPSNYNLYKLSIVPNKHNKILLPPSPYIAISGLDSMYMEAECPKVDSLYLCEKRPKYQTQDNTECIQHLISKQEVLPSCKMTTVALKKEAVEQLDEKHYTISFPYPTKVKISCRQEIYKTLEGSYLAIIPYNCQIRTPEFTIANSNNHIKGFALEIIQLPTFEDLESSSEAPILLNSADLESLHSINTKIIQQTPIKINEASSTSLYHTTIPIYLILSGAGALIVALLYRRKRSRNCHKDKSIETNHVTPAADNTETQNPCPSKIRIDHSNISSSLSHQMSK